MPSDELTLFSSSADPSYMYFDGGSRGNPGPAAWGFLVVDSDGATVVERGLAIGTATNNEAEYAGLIAGLEFARDAGIQRLVVRGDSKLVIEQMAGNWKVRAPGLQQLHRRARDLAGAISQVSYAHVRRGDNTEADRLVNEALDSADGQAGHSVAVDHEG